MPPGETAPPNIEVPPPRAGGPPNIDPPLGLAGFAAAAPKIFPPAAGGDAAPVPNIEPVGGDVAVVVAAAEAPPKIEDVDVALAPNREPPVAGAPVAPPKMEPVDAAPPNTELVAGVVAVVEAAGVVADAPNTGAARADPAPPKTDDVVEVPPKSEVPLLGVVLLAPNTVNNVHIIVTTLCAQFIIRRNLY